MTLTTKVQNKQNPLLKVTLTNLPLQEAHVYPKNLCADSNSILGLPKSVPMALTIGKGKGKCNINDTMPIVIYCDATQLWEHMPSPLKARPPYATWALIKPLRQVQNDAECN